MSLSVVEVEVEVEVVADAAVRPNDRRLWS